MVITLKTILITLGIAALFIIISIVIYNKYLDRIVSGKTHDSHNPLPEPKTTISVVFKLMILSFVILILLGVSTLIVNISEMKDEIVSLKDTIHDLDNETNHLTSELENIKNEMNASASAFSDLIYNISKVDYDKYSVTYDVQLTLKNYNESTTVYFILSDEKTELKSEGDGVFSGSVNCSFFNCDGDEAQINVIYRGISSVYPTDFTGYLLFYDYLPNPYVQTAPDFISGYTDDKFEAEGDFYINLGNYENVKSVSLSYMSDNKILKTIDVTESVLSKKNITLDNDLDLVDDISVFIEVTTKNGTRITYADTLGEAYPVGTDPDHLEFMKYSLFIYSPSGELLFKNR